MISFIEPICPNCDIDLIPEEDLTIRCDICPFVGQMYQVKSLKPKKISKKDQDVWDEE